MKDHGHPALGGIGGLIFGLGLTLVLLTTGTVDLGSPIVAIVPLAGLVLGIVWGVWAPLNRGPKLPTAPPEPSPPV